MYKILFYFTEKIEEVDLNWYSSADNAECWIWGGLHGLILAANSELEVLAIEVFILHKFNFIYASHILFHILSNPTYGFVFLLQWRFLL